MLYNKIMSQRNLNSERVPVGIRHREAFNYLIESAEMHPNIIGIYVVEKTLSDIAKDVGTTLASLYKRGDITDFSDLVDQYSGNNLELIIAGNGARKRDSLLLDRPTINIVKSYAFSSEQLRDVDIPHINRFIIK